jgi:hypothetical protein
MDEEEALPDPAPVQDPAKSEGSGGGTVGAMEGDPAKSEGSGGGTVGAMEGSEVWQEPRKRYVEAVEAEHLFGAIEAIDVPLLDQDDLGIDQLQYVVRDLVGQVNKAHKLLATAGYVVAERSRESHQQAKVSIDMSTEALLKAYEVATLAASSSRQSWKMCITFTGPDMPARTKEAEKRPDTTGRYLAQTLFGVTLRQEEVAIAHFRGASRDYILKFTRTGYGTSHEDLLHASKALGRNRDLQVYAKIAAAEADSEIYFLLRCMIKAGEAENSYTARSGRPAAWLVSAEEEGVSAPYSFGTVMEVRAIMGPAARKEETRQMEGPSQPGRRKRALTREAVGSGLKEAVRDMGLAEDVVRDEAREKGVVQGGGIRWKEKADISIFRGIKMDSVPAWADFGGRGRAGGRGTAMGSRGARGEGGGRGSRGRGGQGVGNRGG